MDEGASQSTDRYEASYASRSHDRAMDALVRSNRAGTYLLVGQGGSGKSTSLIAFSDRLIAGGIEHQLIPCSRERRFVPPMARINLVDGLDDVVATGLADSELIDSLNGSAKRSLNIVTSRPAEKKRLADLLRISGELSIVPLSQEESRVLYERLLKASDVPDDWRFHELIADQIEGGQLRHPQALRLLVSNLASGTIYRNKIQQAELESVWPTLITTQDSILSRIGARPEDVARLSPTEFERLIGELFEKEGYSVEFTKASRDGGVDLFAWRRDIAGDLLTIVQCKRNSQHNPVRVGVVREVLGSMNIHGATAAAIFTTSRFTQPAVEEAAKIRHRLSLKDYLQVIQSIAKHRNDL